MCRNLMCLVSLFFFKTKKFFVPPRYTQSQAAHCTQPATWFILASPRRDTVHTQVPRRHITPSVRYPVLSSQHHGGLGTNWGTPVICGDAQYSRAAATLPSKSLVNISCACSACCLAAPSASPPPAVCQTVDCQWEPWLASGSSGPEPARGMHHLNHDQGPPWTTGAEGVMVVRAITRGGGGGGSWVLGDTTCARLAPATLAPAARVCTQQKPVMPVLP
jgi:hypothetical protein